MSDSNNNQEDAKEYQEYLLKISPQERAKLEKEGLGLDNRNIGKRIDREVMGIKTLQEIQAEKLEKLMERVFPSPPPFLLCMTEKHTSPKD